VVAVYFCPSCQKLSVSMFLEKVSMITLIPLTDSFTIYQLNDYQKIPSQIFDSGFLFPDKNGDEISVVTNCDVNF